MDIDFVSQRFTQLAVENAVPGAQLAVHHDGQTWVFEYGEEEYGSGRRLDRDSKIPIGSISKTFTATLAMILVSDGDLELDTPLTEYLPELGRAGHDLGTRLTLRHLLSHTGGLPSDPDEVQTTSRRRLVLECWQALDPLHRPGAGFSYSNIGYVLAGHLIETVTGMSWWEAMDTVLCAPLGIAPRFVVGPRDASLGARPIATGHAVNRTLGRVRPVAQSLASAAAPAGAVAASVIDLVALGRLHAPAATGPRPPELIDPTDLQEMQNPVPDVEPFGMADGWGLGLAVYRNASSTWLGHDGTGDGTACHLRIDPENGDVVALATNGSTGMNMWYDLVGELNTAGLPVASYDGRHQLTTKVRPPVDCAGSYYNGETEYSVSMLDRDTMYLTVDAEPFAELTLYDGLLFSMRDEDTGEYAQTGRFLTDPTTGGIGWIQIGGRLARRRDQALEVA